MWVIIFTLRTWDLNFVIVNVNTHTKRPNQGLRWGIYVQMNKHASLVGSELARHGYGEAFMFQWVSMYRMWGIELEGMDTLEIPKQIEHCKCKFITKDLTGIFGESLTLHWLSMSQGKVNFARCRYARSHEGNPTVSFALVNVSFWPRNYFINRYLHFVLIVEFAASLWSHAEKE